MSHRYVADPYSNADPPLCHCGFAKTWRQHQTVVVAVPIPKDVAHVKLRIAILRLYLVIPDRIRYQLCRMIRRTKPTAREALRLLEAGERSAFRAGISNWDHGGNP